jgi:hypothetical protein
MNESFFLVRLPQNFPRGITADVATLEVLNTAFGQNLDNISPGHNLDNISPGHNNE